MQKLTRPERKALARAADARLARPAYAPQSRFVSTTGPCRKDINGARFDLRKGVHRADGL